MNTTPGKLPTGTSFSRGLDSERTESAPALSTELSSPRGHKTRGLVLGMLGLLHSYAQPIALGTSAVLGLGLMVACASTVPAGTSGKPQALPESLAKLVTARNADPSNPGKTEAVVKAALSENRYGLAFEEAQRLRELSPDSDEALELLGHACYGLGLFDQAAASYFAANQKRFTEERVLRVARLLIAKGANAEARDFLSDAVNQAPRSWPIVKLLVESQKSAGAKASDLEDFLMRNEGHPEATKALNELNNPPPVVYSKIVQGEGKLVRTRLNDTFSMSILFNETPIWTRLSTSSSGLTLSTAAALKLGLTAETTQVTVRGFGGDKATGAHYVIVPSMKIGDLWLENVPALVLEERYTTEMVATLGLDLLPEYSFMLDRRGEVIEFYPSTVPLPAPSTRTKNVPYYVLGGEMLTEVGLENLDTHQTTRGIGELAIGVGPSLLHAPYVKELGLGKLSSTQTVTLVGIAGYDKAVQVERLALKFSGDTFLGGPFSGAGSNRQKQDTFLAANLGDLQDFTPYLMVGQDVLGRYRIVIDRANQQLQVEAYQP